MLDGTQTNGMGMTSIWDLIVLVIIARMFGFGDDRNNATTAAVTEAQIERAIRASQDIANTNTQLAAIASKQNDCCCQIQLGQKDIIANQIKLADDAQIRDLTQRLTTAENALNNCNQSAALTAAINNAVTPIAQTVAGIMAQLNCGVKSIPYTASVPAYLPPVSTMPLPQFPYAA